jgi:Holliday junction DNA helicase RuvA
MIARLTGSLAECRPDGVVIDVGGVGYGVQVPLGTYYELSRARGPVTLHVHTHVREDALALYGFATADEKTTFETLLAVSGIGPRVALAVLSGIGVAELRECIVVQDRARLQKIPGVGRKTAERMLLELRDRLAPDAATVPTRAAAAGGGSRADALSALANLGYSADAAAQAVDSVLFDHGRDAALADVLRAALGKLAR